ncbi:MAG: hypothetical protein GEV12_00670 [Micromonosporaceae bacterium]|nr:hypothetical protein [Micromonosporaceae bacterium]
MEVEATTGRVVVDGPTLRSARVSQDVPLRRIARTAGMSHGHLSKVEHGEHGRPVTPAILYAYEKCLGIKIAEAVGSGELAQEHRPKQGKDWRPGQLSDFQRRAWRSQVAAVGAGGSVGMPLDRLLHSAGQVRVARPVTDGLRVPLERVAAVLEEAGDLAGAVAHALLWWVIRLRADVDADPLVHAVMARLARRAAREAYTASRHESARVLWLLALEAATAADHPDLRALVLADIAAHHVDVGYHEDALITLRAAEGDERISEETRAALKTVRSGLEPDPS